MFERILSIRKWPPHQLLLLKWSSALFGVFLGTTFHQYLMNYQWLILIASVVLAIPVIVFYLFSNET